MESVELVVFDLDGVIADTEPLHSLSKLEILASFGIQGDTDMERYVGLPNSEYWAEILEQYDLPCTFDTFEQMQYNGILRLMRKNATPLSHGLTELLAAIEAKGIRKGVFSSSDRFYVEAILRFYNLQSRLSPVVGGDDVHERKPAPYGYLRVAAKAGIETSKAVAIEDSEAGTAAAKAAGYRVIGYRNPTSGNQNLAAADWTVESLHEAAGILLPLLK